MAVARRYRSDRRDRLGVDVWTQQQGHGKRPDNARVRAADYAEKVKTANAQIGEARAQQRLAELDLERATRLFQGKAISQADLDTHIARSESAKASLDGALARSGEAGVALGDTVLKAPMDGVVLTRQVEIGTLVSPGQPLVRLHPEGVA